MSGRFVKCQIGKASAAQMAPQTAAVATVRHLDPTKPTVLFSFERSAIERGGNRLLLAVSNNSNTDIEILYIL